MEVPNKVLLVVPHPDDAENGCGGTVALWTGKGAEVVYVLCTNGDKGSQDTGTAPGELAAIREKEQLEAAQVLRVKQVVFLRHPDGMLEDSQQFRGEVVREIRRHRPDVVMYIDPSGHRGHTHRDHRVSARVTLDAVFTYAWRHLYFPDHSTGQGLRPHVVKEIYLWGSEEPNTYIGIGDTLELKVSALIKHASQFPDIERPRQNVLRRAASTGEQAGLSYAESFRVVRFDPDRPLVC